MNGKFENSINNIKYMVFGRDWFRSVLVWPGGLLSLIT